MYYLIYESINQQKEKTMKAEKQKRPEVHLKPNTYQPSKAELEEDLRVKSSFDNAVKSLVTPVEVKRDIR